MLVILATGGAEADRTEGGGGFFSCDQQLKFSVTTLPRILLGPIRRSQLGTQERLSSGPLDWAEPASPQPCAPLADAGIPRQCEGAGEIGASPAQGRRGQGWRPGHT